MPSRLGQLRRLILPLLVLAILAALFVDWLRTRWLPEEEKIRRAVRAVVDGACRRDIGAMLAPVSATYTDRFHPTRDALCRTLQAMWLRYKEVRVDLQGDPLVRLDPEHPDKATADIVAVVLLGEVKGQPPTETLVHRLRGTDAFRILLRQEDGVWRITSCIEPPAQPSR